MKPELINARLIWIHFLMWAFVGFALGGFIRFFTDPGWETFNDANTDLLIALLLWHIIQLRNPRKMA